MSTAFESIASNFGEAGSPAFPEYPQFSATTAPGALHVTIPNLDATLTIQEMIPTRVWQGLIAPFETDEEARLSLRLLAADRAISVHGGTLRPGPDAKLMKVHPAEARLVETGLAFDVLVTEFEAPAHPWAFSLSPPIRQPVDRYHPHLRSDRSLRLASRALHAFCIYSAAEFSFDSHRAQLPQFLDQVAVFLAKHVIWLKTQRLFDASGEMIHDGVDLSTVMSTMPLAATWSTRPSLSTYWEGFWAGRSARNGVDHLTLDPEGQCWCGLGITYKTCHLPWESARYSNLSQP